MKIELTPYKHLLYFKKEGRLLFSLSYHLIVDGQLRLADETAFDGTRVTARLGDSTIQDDITLLGSRVEIRRKWLLEGSFRAGLPFVVRLAGRPDGICVPGQFLGRPVRPAQVSDGPETEQLYREDACAVPCGAAFWGERGSFGVFAEPAQEERETASLTLYFPGDEPMVCIQTPAQPLRHLKDSETSGWYRMGDEPGHFQVEGHLGYERAFHLFLNERPAETAGAYIRQAWNALGGPDAGAAERESDLSETVRRQVSCLANAFLVERNDAVGFVDQVGAAMIPKSGALRGYGAGSTPAIANAFYRLYLECRDKRLKQIAFDAADFFITGQFKSGLFCTEYKLNKKSWWPARHPAPFASVGQMGETLLPLIDLYERSKEDGEQNENWMDYARRAGEFFLGHPLEDGALGTLWGKDGALLENGGLEPCWMALALRRLGRSLRDESYEELARSAAGFYKDRFNGLLKKGDEDVYRETGLIPFFKMAVSFAETDGETSAWRETAVRCGEILATRIFAWRAPFPARSPLGRIGFNSRGGLIEARDQTRISSGSVDFAPDLCRLWKQTGDAFWRQLADAALGFCMQWPDDGPGGASKHLALFNLQGAQPDAFCQTQAGPVMFSGGKGAFGAISSRTPAALLDALIDLRDFLPGEFAFTFDRFDVDISKRQNVGKFMQWLGSYIHS